MANQQTTPGSIFPHFKVDVPMPALRSPPKHTVAEAMLMTPAQWMRPLEVENERLRDVLRTVVVNLERGAPQDVPAIAAWAKEQINAG